MKLFITGAGGFVGNAVVRAALARGHEVVAMVRRASSVETPSDAERRSRLHVVEGDLRHLAGWEHDLASCDAVVHLAAGAGDFFTQFASTVVGTERLLDAMRGAGVGRLVHISTFSIYDYRTIPAGSVLDESSPLEHAPQETDDYTQVKLLQEQLVREFADAGNAVTILRPGAIYGPDRLWDAGLTASMLPGVWLAIGGRVVQKLTYVDNCAEAMVLAAERDEAIGEVLNIVDDRLPTQREYAKAMRRHGLEVPRSIPVPAAIVGAIGRLLQRLGERRFDGRLKLPFYLVPSRFEARFRPFVIPNDRAKAVLGWTPRVDLDHALQSIAKGSNDAGSNDAG